MGADEKRGQKHPGTTPCSFPNGEGWQEKGGRWEEEGKGEEVQGRRAGWWPPWPHTLCRRAWPAPLSLGPAAEIPVLCTAQLACCQSCASSRPGSGKWGTRRAYGRAARKYRAKRLAQGCSGSEAEAGTALPSLPSPWHGICRAPLSAIFKSTHSGEARDREGETSGEADPTHAPGKQLSPRLLNCPWEVYKRQWSQDQLHGSEHWLRNLKATSATLSLCLLICEMGIWPVAITLRMSGKASAEAELSPESGTGLANSALIKCIGFLHQGAQVGSLPPEGSLLCDFLVQVALSHVPKMSVPMSQRSGGR